METITKLLLTPKEIKPSFRGWTVDGVLNPAAVRLKNNKIMLLARIAESGKHQKQGLICPIVVSEHKYLIDYEKINQDRIIGQDNQEGKIIYLKDGTCRLPTISHFREIILHESGLKVEKISEKPNFLGKPGDSDYGVEDPRIAKIGSKYFMTYVGVSVNEGVSTYLAESKDLKNWKRLGIIFIEQNKDVVLFPEKIKGLHVALNRPESLFEFSRPGIWISYSKDLIYWGRGKKLLKPRENSWDSIKIGAGPPPIKTKKGWLLIYHGVQKKEEKTIYSAGAVLLDLKNPEKILARTSPSQPLIEPKEDFEKSGFINDVVFPTGVVQTLGKRYLLIFSGGADSVTTVRKILLKHILSSMVQY